MFLLVHNIDNDGAIDIAIGTRQAGAGSLDINTEDQRGYAAILARYKYK